MRQFDVNVPVDPGPVLLAMSDWSFGKFSDAVQPCLTVVETDFDSLHLMTTSIISIPSNAISVTLLDTSHRDTLSMSRFCNDRIQILLVAHGVGMTEEGFCELAIFLSNESRLVVR